MRELAGDILVICGPAGLVHWAFGDPFLSCLWIGVGIVTQWYRRHRHKPPYRCAGDGEGDTAA
jgi:hypothetical protein